jgi:hypothetical protein
MADLARDWWRLLLTPAGGLPGPIIPTLILIQQSPENVENLKADLPAHIRKDLHEFYNSPPAPAYASIVHGRFAMGGESVGRLFSLFSKSRIMRVVVVPLEDEQVAALFAAQSKDAIIVVKGWPAGTGPALTAQLEMTRRSNIPQQFVDWCRYSPRPMCLVLAGLATHHLAMMVPRASVKFEHMTLRSVANELHRWHYAMAGVQVLFVETSFDESLNPDLANTGLQGLLRYGLVKQEGRRFDIIVLVCDADVAKFRRLNHPRGSDWYSVIFPEDCDTTHTVSASGSATQREPMAEHSFAQHPLMRDFKLGAAQKAAVYGERTLFQEDRVALDEHMAQMHRRAALGR